MIERLMNRFCYRVIGFGYGKVHYTFTRREALAWVGCYDGGAMVLKHHRLQFVRFALKG